MSEPARTETELGIAEFKKRLGAAGVDVIDQRERFHRNSTYFAIGTTDSQTDIVLSREFLDDLPNTREYQGRVART